MCRRDRGTRTTRLTGEFILRLETKHANMYALYCTIWQLMWPTCRALQFTCSREACLSDWTHLVHDSDTERQLNILLPPPSNVMSISPSVFFHLWWRLDIIIITHTELKYSYPIYAYPSNILLVFTHSCSLSHPLTLIVWIKHIFWQGWASYF